MSWNPYDLHDEVAEEFGALVEETISEDVLRSALVHDEIQWRYAARREAERLKQVCCTALPNQTGVASGERLYKRLVTLGKREAQSTTKPRRCGKQGRGHHCPEPAAPGVKLCARHQEMARAAVKRYEEKKKVATREKLQEEREGITHHFTIITRNAAGDGIEEVDGYIQTGLYPDGRVGEIFVKVGKAGEHHAMIDQWAIAFSVALQYGAPFDDLCAKFRHARFEPSGATKNKDIPRCSSVVDYAVQWLLAKYGWAALWVQAWAKIGEAYANEAYASKIQGGGQ